MTNTEAIFKELFAGVMEMSDPAVWTMFAIGGILIWLGVKKDYEPVLLFPMGVGCILANIPGHFAVIPAGGGEPGFLQVLYEAGIANELFPYAAYPPALCHAFCGSGPFRYFCSGASGISFWISFQPGGGDWHHRRGGRSDDDFCGTEICCRTSGASHGDGILLYVPCPDYPAAYYQTADDKAGKTYPHGI